MSMPLPIEPSDEKLHVQTGSRLASGSTSNTMDPTVSREAERQLLFNNEVNDALEIPNGYAEVHVLIIRWHESIDGFEGHGEEISRLEGIFSHKFNYDTTQHHLDNQKMPQKSLNMAIMQHVLDFDGENNLIIVYYTGHGNTLEGDGRAELRLSASDHYVDKKGTYPPHASWTEAERPLLENAEGDVLLILDCCCASSAALKGTRKQSKTYQILAASAAKSPTRGPGKNSFTHALCDSLEDLAEECGDNYFPITQLVQKINSKRTEDATLHWHRRHDYQNAVQLAPLSRNKEKKPDSHEKPPERGSLLLRFSLGVDELGDDKIKNLANNLPRACKEAEIPINCIDWVKMEAAKKLDPWKTAFRRVSVVNAWMRMGQTSNAEEQNIPASLLRKRHNADHSTVLAKKRRTSRGQYRPASTAPMSPTSMGNTAGSSSTDDA